MLDQFFGAVSNAVPGAISSLLSAAAVGVVTLLGILLRRKFKFLSFVSAAKEPASPPTATKADIAPHESTKLDDTESAVKSLALGVLRVARPYQKHEPLTIEQLYDFLHSEDATKLKYTEFREILSALFRSNRLPGLKRDGEQIYIEEEHFAWKTLLAVDDKALIGKTAFSLIRSGQVIALDAGSTTLQVAKCIAAGFRDQSLSQIVIVTNSYLVADAIVSTSIELGLKDHDPLFRLYVVGGRVRLNTMAIVDDNSAVDADIFHDFDRVLPALGGADIGFVGTNGIMKDRGLTTNDPGEKRAKSSLLRHSRRKIVVTDPSKFGVEQDQVFASFADGLEIITTRHGDPRILRDYAKLLSSTPSSLIFC